MVRKQIQVSFLKEKRFNFFVFLERRRNVLRTLLLTELASPVKQKRGVGLAWVQVVIFREMVREESGCGIVSECRIPG